MNLYLDTSAIIVMIVDERDPEELLAAIASAVHIYAAVVALPEASCALERRRRGRALKAAAFKRATSELRAAWPHVHRIVVDERLAEAAAVAGTKYGLRGYDAVHLAAALLANNHAPIAMATWDGELHRAAQAAGLRVVPAALPAPG